MIGIHRYAQTRNETASKERLMVLLFETALKHIRFGAAALEGGRVAEALGPLSRAGEIVDELRTTLDPSHAPQLCAQLTDVYRFVSLRLLSAVTGRSARLAREAERAFAPIADAFAQAVSAIPAPAR